MTQPRFQPTPLNYAGLMLGAGAVALTVAAIGAGAAWRPAMMCVLMGAIAAPAPALFGPREPIGSWGFAVIAGSIVRTLLLLVLGLATSPAMGEEKRAFWLAVTAGAGVLLAAEAAVSIAFLSKLERARTRPSAERAGA